MYSIFYRRRKSKSRRSRGTKAPAVVFSRAKDNSGATYSQGKIFNEKNPPTHYRAEPILRFVNDTEEKGSDVNLASHLLMDGFCDSYDVALVMSQDTDLLEAMRMVRDDLNKEIVVAWFDGSDPGKKHKKVASAIRHVTNGMLTRSQFPNPVIGRGGKKIYRPENWDFE